MRDNLVSIFFFFSCVAKYRGTFSTSVHKYICNAVHIYRRTVHAIVTCKDLKDALAEKSVKISIMNFVNFGQK